MLWHSGSDGCIFRDCRRADSAGGAILPRLRGTRNAPIRGEAARQYGKGDHIAGPAPQRRPLHLHAQGLLRTTCRAPGPARGGGPLRTRDVATHPLGHVIDTQWRSLVSGMSHARDTHYAVHAQHGAGDWSGSSAIGFRSHSRADPRTQRCQLTAEGLSIGLAYPPTQARVLGPVLSATSAPARSLDCSATQRLDPALPNANDGRGFNSPGSPPWDLGRQSPGARQPDVADRTKRPRPGLRGCAERRRRWKGT